MRRIACVVGLLLLSSAASADATLAFVPGQWKITRVISLGSAHTKTKPVPTSECLSPDAPAPAASVGWPAGVTCTDETTRNGSKVEWSFRCTVDATTITGTGTLTYAGKTMSGTINVTKETVSGAAVSGQRGLLKITGA